MRQYYLSIIIIIILLIPVKTFSAEKLSKADRKKHFTCAELSLMGQTRSFNDPYSLPAGIGVSYNYYGFSIPFFAGFEAEWFGFVPLNENYSDSMMIVPSINLGYSIIKELNRGSQVHISPYISAGQYFRSIIKNDITYNGSRPVFKSGFDLVLLTEKNTVFSIGLFYIMILDNNPVLFPGGRNRIGYAF